LLLLLLAPLIAPAVTVSPAALYIDSRSRSATLTLYNPGTLPEEIEISFAFGYPRTDGEGNIQVLLVPPDSVAAGEPSAAGWLRAFPQRLVLQPDQRQVVRILAQPPAELADGEYWARVLVLSRGGQPPVEQRQGDVTMQLAIETVIATPLSYRKGVQTTGVQVDSVVAERTPDGLRVTFDLTRTGSAAYLGRLRLELVAPNGAILAEGEESIAVYRTLRRRALFPRELEIPAGSRIRYVLDTERPDLGRGGALPVPPLSGTISIAEAAE
jgi:hypothetical protein